MRSILRQFKGNVKLVTWQKVLIRLAVGELMYNQTRLLIVFAYVLPLLTQTRQPSASTQVLRLCPINPIA